VDRVFSGDSVSGNWSGPVAGAMSVGRAFRELAFGEDCAGPNEGRRRSASGAQSVRMDCVA
jgi:hypothetical protein